jgi:hypothetical protein
LGFGAIKVNSSLNPITSTYPWAVVVSPTMKERGTYAYPVYPNNLISEESLTKKSLKDTFVLNWELDSSFYTPASEILLKQIDPFVFKATGFSLPEFLFSMRIPAGDNVHNFEREQEIYTVAVSPENIQQKVYNSRHFLPNTDPFSYQPWSSRAHLSINSFLPNQEIQVPSTSPGTNGYCFESLQLYGRTRTAPIPEFSSGNQLQTTDLCPPPPPSTYPQLQINWVRIEPAATYYDPTFHLTTTREYYYKGEQVKITLQIQNTGTEVVYYVYAKFRIESAVKKYVTYGAPEYYYKGFDAEHTVFVASSIAIGSTMTVTVNIGPLIGDRFALNSGIFKLTKVSVWASNHNELSLTTNNAITIEPDPYSHVVFALVMVDNAWIQLQSSFQGFQDINTIYNLIWPRFWHQYSINYRFLKTELSWNSGNSYDIEEVLTQARTEAGRILGLSTPDKLWEFNDRILAGETRAQNHGFDILIALIGRQASHFGIGSDGTAMLAAINYWGRWADGIVKQSDELLQHELSHTFGANDNNDSEDVMDYQSFWGLYNWLWDLDPIRMWKPKSYTQMLPHVGTFDGRW